MARSRKISTELSSDERLAEVSAGSVDHVEVVLYLLSIPHADDWGRLPGSPSRLRLLVVPGLEVTAERVREAIEAIASAGLWMLYEDSAGKTTISFPVEEWWASQSYINVSKREDDTRSSFGAPPRISKDQQGSARIAKDQQKVDGEESIPATGRRSSKENGKSESAMRPNQQESAKISASPSPSPSPSYRSYGSEGGKKPLTPQQRKMQDIFHIFESRKIRSPDPKRIAGWWKIASHEQILATLGSLTPDALAKGANYLSKVLSNATKGLTPGSSPHLGSDHERSTVLEEMS